MLARKEDILYETDNMYLLKTGDKLEIRLRGFIHSIVIASLYYSPQNKNNCIKFMKKAETNINYLRKYFKHW